MMEATNSGNAGSSSKGSFHRIVRVRPPVFKFGTANVLLLDRAERSKAMPYASLIDYLQWDCIVASMGFKKGGRSETDVESKEA